MNKAKIKKMLSTHPFLSLLTYSIFYIPLISKLLIKQYVIFPISGLIRLTGIFKSSCSIQQLKYLKNKYSGNKCYIVATGPSLRTEDLDKLSEKKAVTFGLNSIYKTYEKTNWRPDFYVLTDLELLQDFLLRFGSHFFENKANTFCFTDAEVRKKVLSDDKMVFLPVNRLLHGIGAVLHRKSIFDFDFRFSRNPVWCVYDYFTVTNTAILLAAYMGFKEIYLLGVDCNYLGIQKHADGMTVKEDALFSDDDYAIYVAENMKRGYEYLNKKLKKNGVTIYNATRGGKLEVFTRKNFDDVINEN